MHKQNGGILTIAMVSLDVEQHLRDLPLAEVVGQSEDKRQTRRGDERGGQMSFGPSPRMVSCIHVQMGVVARESPDLDDQERVGQYQQYDSGTVDDVLVTVDVDLCQLVVVVPVVVSVTWVEVVSPRGVLPHAACRRLIAVGYRGEINTTR